MKFCEGEFNYFCLRIYYVTYNYCDFVKLRDTMFAKMFSMTQILLKLSQVKFRRILAKFSYLPTSFILYVCLKLAYFNYSA